MKDKRRSAPRFPLELPTTLRWEEENRIQTVRTRTQNISRSGLYLQIARDRRPNSRIEFEIELPAPQPGGTRAVLHGSGWLVRREKLGNNSLGFAAVIDRCTLRPLAPPTVPEQPTGKTVPPVEKRRS